jgi:hypothetical protein
VSEFVDLNTRLKCEEESQNFGVHLIINEITNDFESIIRRVCRPEELPENETEGTGQSDSDHLPVESKTVVL